jgi:hypothetical protein
MIYSNQISLLFPGNARSLASVLSSKIWSLVFWCLFWYDIKKRSLINDLAWPASSPGACVFVGDCPPPPLAVLTAWCVESILPISFLQLISVDFDGGSVLIVRSSMQRCVMEELTSTLHPHGTMTLAPCTPATILPMAPHEVSSIEDVDALGLLNTGLEVGSSSVRHGDVMRQGNTSCTIV